MVKKRKYIHVSTEFEADTTEHDPYIKVYCPMAGKEILIRQSKMEKDYRYD